MIKQLVTLTKYDWEATILFNVTCNDLFIINKELESINCPNALIEEALENFENCNYNCGLTYSNASSRQSLIIIGKASSMIQAFNTTVHEAYHFISQLSRINSITSEEERATLIGDFVMQLDDILRDIVRKH